LRTIAISNQKGGSGKTTTAVNLSAALAEQGHRILLVDLDPQASASAWLGFRDGNRGLLATFTENVDLCHLTRHTRFANVDIVPGSPWLVGVDKALSGEVAAETLLRTSFVPCRVDLRTNLSREIVSRLREKFADVVFDSIIRENVRVAEAPSFELPITSYAPHSTGAADYRAVAAEFLVREQRRTGHEQIACSAGR
jgi:cellulose biosynthesis protein BcsQ